MRNPLSIRALFLVGCAALAVSAADFNPLLSVVRATWPERQHIGIICDYATAKGQVDELAAAASPDCRITVVDTKRPSLAVGAAQILADRKADYLVLLPEDRVFGEGCFDATNVVRRLALRGIPSVGTGPLAIEQGAVFSVGEKSKGELLVTDKLRGTISVILPDKATFGRGQGLASAGGAKVQVVGLP